MQLKFEEYSYTSISSHNRKTDNEFGNSVTQCISIQCEDARTSHTRIYTAAQLHLPICVLVECGSMYPRCLCLCWWWRWSMVDVDTAQTCVHLANIYYMRQITNSSPNSRQYKLMSYPQWELNDFLVRFLQRTPNSDDSHRTFDWLHKPNSTITATTPIPLFDCWMYCIFASTRVHVLNGLQRAPSLPQFESRNVFVFYWNLISSCTINYLSHHSFVIHIQLTHISNKHIYVHAHSCTHDKKITHFLI